MSDHKKEKNYITPLGLSRLIEELSFLVKTDRPEVVKTVSWAAGNGDRSENADYIYGKKRLREIDKRIRFLNSRIGLAIEVDPLSIKSNKVQFSATVRLLDDQGLEKMVVVVGVDEIKTDKGHISWRSPLGSALIGKEVGDTIEVPTPKGIMTFEILNIEYKKID